MEEEEQFAEEILPEPEGNLAQCRKWFQAAVDGGKKWRVEAKEEGVRKKVCKKSFRDRIIMGGFVYG